MCQQAIWLIINIHYTITVLACAITGHGICDYSFENQISVVGFERHNGYTSRKDTFPFLPFTHFKKPIWSVL